MGCTKSKTKAKDETQVPKDAPTIVICSSSGEESVEDVKGYIKENMSDFLKSAKVVFKQLPYNVTEMKKFNFRGIEALILCHSVDIKGPFSSGNESRSIYHKFLYKAKNCLGKKKVAVIMHDYKIPLDANETYDNINKPKFKMASLVLSLSRNSRGGPIQLTKGQEDKFMLFVRMAVEKLPFYKKISTCFYKFFYVVIRQ